MEITSYSDFRQRLKRWLDQVFEHHMPLIVTRKKGEDVVVLSKSDYDSMLETFYLLKSPRNAQRLMDALQEYEQGKGSEKELEE
ncbi:MAG: type II toxin-antitoxin system prevent-host-death family antitoxin [Fulvivirga sp.]